jgi:hypothetical protein
MASELESSVGAETASGRTGWRQHSRRIPLTSAPFEIRSGLGLCGEHCSTTNVGLRASMTPSLYLVLC